MISILKNNEKFTPYNFYSIFLKEVASQIKNENNIDFKLVENGDTLIYESNYSIEPITIPLLLSLIEQLSKHYQKPLKLHLHNNTATRKVLNFLHKSDFFYIAGNNKNPYHPYGRCLIEFNEAFIGDLSIKNLRLEHRVRCYSLQDNDLSKKIEKLKREDEKRDFLISEYIYTVRDHFQELLFDNINTYKNTESYVEILSELITNGVLHSKSTTYALMFVNNYSTKFSISDNGIGFTSSMKTKSKDLLYEPLELKNKLDNIKILKINNKNIIENLNYIIETLYFSSLKNRRGLFDLMTTVVLNSNGYFRIHSENSQVIISNRMEKELNILSQLRNDLFDIHKEILIDKIEDGSRDKAMILIKDNILENFISMYKNICQKYNEDFKYSSIRFYNVKFRGVHIEVEIPNEKL